MPWEYSENICEKWLRETSEMHYSITARKIRTTRTTTSGTESTTMWTPMTTLTLRTSMIAWRITIYTEPARIVSQSFIITLTFMTQERVLHFSPHPHAIHVCDLFILNSTLYFSAFLLSVPFFHLSDEQQPEFNKQIMENLHNSATSHRVVSPRPMSSTSSRTHQSPFSFKIPAADQDVDDLTLGEDKSIASYKVTCQSVSCRRL